MLLTEFSAICVLPEVQVHLYYSEDSLSGANEQVVSRWYYCNGATVLRPYYFLDAQVAQVAYPMLFT